MVMKVYGMPNSTSVARVLACLEEMGLEYELVKVDFSKGEHKQPAHLARHPFGQLPAFEDGDLTLIESRAITRYIVRKYKGNGYDLLREQSIEEEALVNVWMEVEGQQYNYPITTVVFNAFFAPFFGLTPDEAALTANVEKLGKVLDVYEVRLSENKYLAGDFFSLADLNHLPYTFYLMLTPYASLINSRPHVKAWWEDISGRPACQKVILGMQVLEKHSHTKTQPYPRILSTHTATGYAYIPGSMLDAELGSAFLLWPMRI